MHKRPQVFPELGFDAFQVGLGNSANTRAISFTSMEDAKAYLAAFKGRVVSGNVHLQKTGTHSQLQTLLERNDIEIPEEMA